MSAAEMAPPAELATQDPEWVSVCRWDELVPDRGVCALVDGQPVAVFRCSFGDGLYAVDNVDPFSGASVLSRGLVGATAEGVVFVASPLRKQRFDLSTGTSLDDPSMGIRRWKSAVIDGVVMVTGAPAPIADGPRTITVKQ